MHQILLVLPFSISVQGILHRLLREDDTCVGEHQRLVIMRDQTRALDRRMSMLLHKELCKLLPQFRGRHLTKVPELRVRIRIRVRVVSGSSFRVAGSRKEE